MTMMVILIRQILIMFIFMVMGFLMNRGHLISGQGSGDIARVLLYLVVPAVVIRAFQIEATPEIRRNLLIAFAAAEGSLLFSVLISRIFFKKDPIAHFASAFDNPGFFGLPIVTAVLGSANVVYAAPFMASLTFFQWTYGVYQMTGDRSRMSLKAVLLNPVAIALAVGLLFFFLPISMPAFPMQILSGLADLNTPLSMILLGFYLGSLKLRELFKGDNVVSCMVVRLLLIPILTIGLLSLIPARFLIIRQVILILSSAPVGANVAIFADLTHNDYPRAAKLVSLSTLFSIATLPFVVFLSNLLWGVG